MSETPEQDRFMRRLKEQQERGLAGFVVTLAHEFARNFWRDRAKPVQ